MIFVVEKYRKTEKIIVKKRVQLMNESSNYYFFAFRDDSEV